jgi:hypothetical protein
MEINLIRPTERLSEESNQGFMSPGADKYEYSARAETRKETSRLECSIRMSCTDAGQEPSELGCNEALRAFIVILNGSLTSVLAMF